MNRRLIGVGATAVASLVLLTGCANVGRKGLGLGNASRNLIFNPQRTGIPVQAIPRSDWPSTIAFSLPRETIDYRETISDIQGQSIGRQDHLIRRFSSVRTGRVRR